MTGETGMVASIARPTAAVETTMTEDAAGEIATVVAAVAATMVAVVAAVVVVVVGETLVAGAAVALTTVTKEIKEAAVTTTMIDGVIAMDEMVAAMPTAATAAAAAAATIRSGRHRHRHLNHRGAVPQYQHDGLLSVVEVRLGGSRANPNLRHSRGPCYSHLSGGSRRAAPCFHRTKMIPPQNEAP